MLSHFHADHYMGLSKGFKQGRIICSPITAALVRLKLRVPPERLVVLELGTELTDLLPVFETIVNTVPAPAGDPEATLQVLFRIEPQA